MHGGSLYRIFVHHVRRRVICLGAIYLQAPAFCSNYFDQYMVVKDCFVTSTNVLVCGSELLGRKDKMRKSTVSVFPRHETSYYVELIHTNCLGLCLSFCALHILIIPWVESISNELIT